VPHPCIPRGWRSQVEKVSGAGETNVGTRHSCLCDRGQCLEDYVCANPTRPPHPEEVGRDSNSARIVLRLREIKKRQIVIPDAQSQNVGPQSIAESRVRSDEQEVDGRPKVAIMKSIPPVSAGNYAALRRAFFPASADGLSDLLGRRPASPR